MLRTISGLSAFSLVLFVVPCVIVFTMITMYRSVSKIEQQMRNYGVGALRLRTKLVAAPTTTNSVDANSRRGFASKMKRWLTHHSWYGNTVQQKNREAAVLMCLPLWRPRFCCRAVVGAGDQGKKSNTMRSQKRAVLYMAFGYAGSWLLVFFPFTISHFIIVEYHLPHTVGFLTALQGFYNFLVFMAPKVRTTRMMAMRRREKKKHLTWCHAFYKAYMSRGLRYSKS
jgi:hypothetical protein